MQNATITRCLSAADFAAPIDDRWFEDYVPGSIYEYGYVTITAEEITEFARSYDPQSIHADPVAAAAGPFGGLIASGLHTGALAMQMYVNHYLSRVASMASPGIDEMRWQRPVRPGDTLRLRTTVLTARVTQSDPARGLVQTLAEVLNSRDGVVMSFRPLNFLRRRGM